MDIKQDLLFGLLCYFVLFSFSCKSVEDPKPFEWPPTEQHEQMIISFGLPDIGLNFTDSTSICQSPRIINQALDQGGSSGFLYRFGIRYDQQREQEEVNTVTTKLYVRGLEETTSTYIPFEKIIEICNNKPSQCFIRFSLVYQNKLYSNVNYETIWYNAVFNDPNAFYSYSFPETDDNVLECFDNQLIQPVNFEYDGYIYSNEKQDSLKVENLKSEFVIFEFY